MGRSVLKTLFGAIVFVGLIRCLLVGIVENGGTKVSTTAKIPLKGSFKGLDVIPRNSPVVIPHLDPNYMSKRRVPNGPDPIHNRRAGKSKQPPGRA